MIKGNFFKNIYFIKNHFKLIKLEINPFFQKEKIQLFLKSKISGINTPKFLKFNKILNIFIKFKIEF